MKKGQARIYEMGEKTVGLYAAELAALDMRADHEEVYGLQISPDLLSRVPDTVMGEFREWQSKAFGQISPSIILDAILEALRVKVEDALTTGWSRTSQIPIAALSLQNLTPAEIYFGHR